VFEPSSIFLLFVSFLINLNETKINKMIGVIIISKFIVLQTVLDQFVLFVFNHFVLHFYDFFVSLLQFAKL
jgi:hypothetical protein